MQCGLFSYVKNQRLNQRRRFFFKFAERQDAKIKIVRSDNGAEFIGLRTFFAEQGVIHQTSCVDTPQQNERVERKHRHILNVARILLFQAKLPVKFRGESVLTATYLINRTPSSVLQNKTPYELIYGSAPSYDNLCTFGALCYARRIARNKDKFWDRIIKCIFIGYPVGQKGWLVYDLETERSFVSLDVIFYESQFLFMETTEHSPSDPVQLPLPLHPAVFDEENVTPTPSVDTQKGE